MSRATIAALHLYLILLTFEKQALILTRGQAVAFAGAWSWPESFLMIVELFAPGLVRVEGRDPSMAVRAGVMIVHPIFVPPDFDGTWPEDEDAEAEQSAVRLLFAGPLDRHSRLRILATRGTGQFHGGSFEDCHIILVALLDNLGGCLVRG